MSYDIENLNSVLFIRFGAIGDVVHTTAAYQTLRQHVKNIKIDYLTSGVMQELLNNDGMLREVISITDRSYEGFFRLAQDYSSNKYDLVINLQPSLKSRFFCFAINAGKVINYKKYKPRGKQSHIHAVNNFYQTVQPLIPEVAIPNNLKIYLNKEVTAWAQHKLQSENIKHTLGIIPGVSAARSNKLWPKTYWKELLDFLTNQRSMNIIIFGGTNENELATELQQVNKSKIRNYCGKLTISQTAGILSLCMLVIGGDTGPSHIASAVGPKVIGLYGPTASERSGIYGKGHEIIRGDFNCQCCEKAKCTHKKNDGLYAPCMIALTVDQVIKAIAI